MTFQAIKSRGTVIIIARGSCCHMLGRPIMKV